ncbi:hypothetical protein B0J17DRAFT_667848 [Rhizoctonia solani]|nr:hypothetical protein B0J17DRAFT_667848 [Rhizoctonia solani]
MDSQIEFSPRYTISLQGRDFQLDRSQIEFDSPNYFTMCFLGDFREAQTRRVELSRDPDLFQIIVSYLSGYSVLPLAARHIPATMSSATAMRNLRTDANFYRLQGLIQDCDRLINHTGIENVNANRFLVLGAKSYNNIDELDSMDDEYYTHDPIFTIPTRASWKTYVTEENLDQEPLNQLATPQSSRGTEELRLKSVVENFIRNSIKDYSPLHWRLVGWSSKKTYEGMNEVSELIAVVEDLQRSSGNAS